MAEQSKILKKYAAIVLVAWTVLNLGLFIIDYSGLLIDRSMMFQAFSHWLIWTAGVVMIMAGAKWLISDMRKLRRSEIEWENTFEAINDPIMVIDTDYRILRANKAMADAIGLAPEDVIGLTCYEIVHGKDCPSTSCPHSKLLSDGCAHSEEIFEERLGGEFIISVSPIYDDKGRLLGSVHAARNISERVQAEKMVRKFAKDLEILLSASGQMTMTKDKKSLYRRIVATCKDILEFDCSTLMLLSDDRQRLSIEDCVGFPESMIGTFSLMKGQGLSTLVAVNKRPDVVLDFSAESRFTVPPIVFEMKLTSALAVPMIIDDDVIGVLIGHTKEKREFSPSDIKIYQHIANQAAVAIRNLMNIKTLSKNERKLRHIIESIGEGLYVLDGSGDIVLMNTEAERLLGWTEAELKGRNIHNIIHNRNADGVTVLFEDCPMHRVMITHKQYMSEDEVFVHKSGRVFPVLVISTPLVEDGAIDSSITVFRDISEKQKIEKEREALIEQLQKALAEIKTLHGILPICSYCKKIRDDKGAWKQLEAYISEHTDAMLSHGMCEDCAKKIYPQYFDKDGATEKQR